VDVGLGSRLCENGKGERALRSAHPPYRQLVDESAQFPVPGATSEKFVLANIRLDAFLHSQGQIKDGQRVAMTAGTTTGVGGAVQASMRSIRADAQRLGKACLGRRQQFRKHGDVIAAGGARGSRP
jgi:hypothetical protein